MNNIPKKKNEDNKFTTDNPSILISIQNLMDLTRRSASTCKRHKKDILAKGGKDKNDPLTVGDVSKAYKLSIEYILKVINTPKKK